MSDYSYRPVRAMGTTPRVRRAEQQDGDHEPDIQTERGFARHKDVIITEAFDESDGASRVRHAGEDPKLHQILLTERAQLHRHRVSEEQRSRRLLAWLASALLLGSAAILAFSPQTTNVYLGAAFLIAAAGAFGIKAFRIKLRDFELVAGERPARDSEREP